MPGEPLPVQLSDAAFQAVVADVLIMPVFDDDEPTTLGLPAAPQAILAAARKQREFKAKPYEQFWMAAPADWNTHENGRRSRGLDHPSLRFVRQNDDARCSVRNRSAKSAPPSGSWCPDASGPAGPAPPRPPRSSP